MSGRLRPENIESRLEIVKPKSFKLNDSPIGQSLALISSFKELIGL